MKPKHNQLDISNLWENRKLWRKNYNSKANLPLVILYLILLLSGGLLFQSCNLDDDDPVAILVVDKLLVADNMVSPIGLVAVPDDSRRLFVIDQIGKIWIIDGTGSKLEEPFIDISSKMISLNGGYDERGLLGLAFHPDYASNGRVFLHYTAPPAAGGPEPGELWNNLSRISEFAVSASNPNTADIGSEKVILEVNQPQGNHQGGTIAFGPDDYLYISLGDGGRANDVAPGHLEDWYEVNEGGNGQNIEESLLGSMLRIDINSGNPYSIPADNPFVGQPGLDEIYAYGFRNPFRFSFDMSGTRELFVGDAGQKLWEEVSIVENGGNYGWNVKEGTHCFDAANPSEVLESCPDEDIYGNPLIDPVIELNNGTNPAGGKATTVIGGNVYRGNSIPDFRGNYIFGTFSQSIDTPNGELFIANPAVSGLWTFSEIELESSPNDVGHYLKGFGQDLDGEIYIAVSSNLGPSGNSGKIFKLGLTILGN